MLRELFEALKKLALSYYTPILNDLQLPLPGALHLQTSHTLLPHPVPFATSVTAKTRALKQPEHKTSVIEIAFQVRDFDSESLMVMPYILFHEIFIHGYQQLAMGDRFQTDGVPDAFGEGWMDWLALEILKATLVGTIEDTPELRSFARSEASLLKWRRLHDARSDYISRPDLEALNIHTGARVAEHLRELLGYDVFLKLSLGINLLPLPIKRRTELVWDIHKCLVSRSKTLKSSLAVLLDKLVRDAHYRHVPGEVLRLLHPLSHLGNDKIH